MPSFHISKVCEIRRIEPMSASSAVPSAASSPQHGAAVTWIFAIERLDTGYAYPFAALSFVFVFMFVFVPVGARIPMVNRFRSLQLFGIAVILIGVTVSSLAR